MNVYESGIFDDKIELRKLEASTKSYYLVNIDCIFCGWKL